MRKYRTGAPAKAPCGDPRIAVAYLRGTEAERAEQRASIEAWARGRVRIAAVLEDGPGRGTVLGRPGILATVDAILAESAGLVLVSLPAVILECSGPIETALHVILRGVGASVRATCRHRPPPPPPPPKPPFGMRRVKGQLVVDAYEQAVRARVLDLYRQGFGPTEISRRLAEQRLTGRTGKPLSGGRVRAIVAES
jgi:hypothetical protein